MKKIRNSNIELLRILSIIMITISHYCIHGVGRTVISNLNLSINRFILEFLTLGNLGSILFVLISRYYLSNSNNIKLKKILRIILQVVFYSVLIYLILVILGIENFNTKSLIKNLLPITFKSYWFITAYIILYIFHPFINKLFNCFNQKEHFIFISLMFIIFSVLPTLTTNDFYANELIQFLMYYSIGAYLFRYPKNLLNRNNNSLKITIISAVLIIISIISLDIIGVYKPTFGFDSIYFLSRTSFLSILFCIGLFNIFNTNKVYENKLINFISSLILGVYLISDNKHLRPIIWENIFKNIKYINSPYLILHIIISIIIIIIICLIIDLIRKELIEKYFFYLIDKYIDDFQNKIHTKIKKISNKNL